MKIIITLLTLLITSFLPINTFAQVSAPIELSQELIPLRKSDSYIISPDNQSVIYKAKTLNVNSDSDWLFRVPIVGGPGNRIIGGLGVEGKILDFRISDDSQHVVFLITEFSSNSNNLYRVPIKGGLPVKLNPTLSSNQNIANFEITNGSASVVYIADHRTNDVNELFSVSILGGESTRLNTDLASNVDVQKFSISNDGKRVVYSASTVLSSVSVTGEDHRVITALYSDSKPAFEITPNSEHVVFNNLLGSGPALFTAPITGDSSTQLNTLNSSTSVTASQFKVSNDSQYVVYLGSVGSDGSEIFSTPLSGGNTTQLSDDDVSSGDFSLNSVGQWKVSSDSKYVAYIVNVNMQESAKLRSVPIIGGERKTISGETLSRTVEDFRLTPDGTHAVFAMRDFASSSGNAAVLYTTSIKDGNPIKISKSFTYKFNGSKFEVSGDGSRVFYLSDQETKDQQGLYTVWLFGNGDTRIIQLPTGSSVNNDFAITSDGSFTVFSTSPSSQNSKKLYARKMRSTSDNDEQICFSIKTKNQKSSSVCI